MIDHDYRGFRGRFEMNLGTHMYEGEVPLVRGCIPFSGTSELDARRRMEAAVDSYLNMCKLEGVAPSSPTTPDAVKAQLSRDG
jgi:predicted HicB family RNase H-like nuclease